MASWLAEFLASILCRGVDCEVGGNTDVSSSVVISCFFHKTVFVLMKL